MKKHTTVLVIICIALVVALAGYKYFCYPPSMLTLQVRTFEKGHRAIEVVDRNGGIHKLKIEIGDDQGNQSIYAIDLPRAPLQEIRVAPLGPVNSYQIDRVSLRNDQAAFSWDNHGACTMKTLPQGKIKRESCQGNQPVLTFGDDRQLKITNIPSTFSMSNAPTGLLAGVISFIAVVIAGSYLVKTSPDEQEQSEKISFFFYKVLILVIVVMYFIQMWALWRYSVDLPFWEEWEYFLPEALPKGLTWDWLFSFSGYHRVVPTKLMAWLNLKLLGLDFKLQKIFNYVIFAGEFVILLRLKNKILGNQNFLLFPAFLLFLLCPILYENHSNSYQSQIHLVIIFAIAALFHVYAPDQHGRSFAFLFLFLLLGINTFSAGMVIAAVLLPCWVVYVVSQIRTKHLGRQKGVVLLLVGIGIIAMAAASWILAYGHPSDCGALLSPFSKQFWDTFLNLVSFSFGIEINTIVPGVLCLLVITVPVILLWLNKDLRRQREVWIVSTGIVVFLAILATISVTRGNLVGTAKTSRYAEFGLILIPLTSITWWLVLIQPRYRTIVLAVFWLACVASFSDDWSYAPYRDIGQMGQLALEDIEGYAKGSGSLEIPWSYCKPLTPHFEGAKALRAKFTRQFADIYPDTALPKAAPVTIVGPK